MSQVNKIQSIQILRAIAGLIVVLFHVFMVPTFRTLAGDSFEFGKFGVDIFFVISGAIMAYIITFENSPALFLRKRMARIYPVYWECYLLIVLLLLISHKIFGIRFMFLEGLGHDISLLPFEWSGSNGRMVVSVAWSLYYEMIFYLVVLASLCLFSEAKFGIYLFFFSLFFLPIEIFDKRHFFEFIAGFLAMEFIKKRNVVDLILTAACIWTLYIFKLRDIGWAICLGSILFIFAGTYFKIPKFKFLDAAADFSYSLYLIHLPLILLADKLCQNFSSAQKIIFLSFWIPMILLLAHLNFIFFEKKVALKLKRFF